MQKNRRQRIDSTPATFQFTFTKQIQWRSTLLIVYGQNMKLVGERKAAEAARLLAIVPPALLARLQATKAM